MAIVQISKIQVRSGSLVDLPQLDEAEFGWASDDKRLFIGKTTPNENVEVLTSYSQLNFSQIVGSYGNLDIANTVADGEILTFDGANWVNRGGSAGGLISLGNISNVQIDGGAIGYIMETDGAGNLAWTPKGTLYSAITNFHPTTFTGSIAEATVTAGSFVIGQTYQIKTVGTTNFVTIGASANTIDVVFTATGVGTGDGTAYLTTLTVTAVSSGYIGVNSAIQTSGMTITSGTYVVSQITGTVGLVGTYYLNKHHTLSSTTIYGPLLMQVANTVPYTNGTEISISGVQGVSNATVNGLTFYLSITANYASSGNVALYTDFARVLPTNGTTVTYTNAPNAIATAQIGSGSGGAGAIGGSNGMVQFNSSGIFNGDSGFTFNLTAPKTLTVDGNFNISNVVASNTISATQFISNIAIGTPPLIITSTTLVPNLYVARANVSDNDVVTTQTTGTFFPTFVNSSSTGNLAMGSNANLSFNAATGNLSTTLLNVTSNANVGNLGTAGRIIATGNITGGNLITAGFANIASNANIGTTLSVVGNANVGNLGTAGVIIATGNITGGNLITAGFANVGTNANIGTTLSVIGNANVGNLGTAGLIVATGNITSGNANLGNLVTANFFSGNGYLLTGVGNATALVNGNSNVTIPSANGNVNISVAGNANIIVITGTGVNVAGTLNATGNISAPFFIGNVQGNISGNLVVPGSNTAVIFNYSGNANASDAFKFDYAANALTVIGNIVSSGANNVFSGNGSALTALNASNVSSGTLAQARLANASLTVNGTSIALGGSGTVTATATNALTIGSGLGGASYNGSAAVTITNAGVTALTTSSGLSTNTSATGAVSITNTGVTSLANGGGITASASTGAVTLGSTATSVNTASAIVARDASGNFAAGTITATLSGSATSAGSATTANAVAGANVSGTVPFANAAVYISTTDLPSSASNCSPVFSLGSGAGQTLYQDTAGLIYKPSTNTLYTTNFVGTLTGNASSATTVQVDVLGSGTQYLLLGAVGAGVGQTPMTYSTLTYATSTNILTTNISGNVITTGSNVTAGTITGNWSLSAGSKLNATYADLAEKYVSDALYTPGTVLVFGGNFEVTKANSFDSSAVAGVVSTNPAYLMNSACDGEFTVELALIGRAPVNVCGPVTKGDLMVTGPNGHAVSNNMARAGTVIGKSLENFTGEFGTIEIVVGKT